MRLLQGGLYFINVFSFENNGETRIMMEKFFLACGSYINENFLRYHYVSQFTVETYCSADGRCLFKQPQSVIYHWNQYDEEI